MSEMASLNKLEALEEQGVRIAPTCATCVYSDFPQEKDWGDCAGGSYVHLKTGKTRALPVHRTFVCPVWDRVPFARGPSNYGGSAMSTLGKYARLVEWLDEPCGLDHKPLSRERT